MKCMYCKGQMNRGKTPFHIDRGGVHLTVDDVPAWICKQCGEAYFEESEVESIQAMIRAVHKQAEKLSATA